MNGAAVSALAGIMVGIKCFLERWQIPDQMFHRDFDAMNQFATGETVPVESVALAWPRGFDDEPDRAALRPLRRMRNIGRQQEDVAFANRHVENPALLPDLEHHVAFELVEEFFNWVVVEIDALVGSANDLYRHLAVFKDFLVAYWRFQQVLVLGDPFLEVEWMEPPSFC